MGGQERTGRLKYLGYLILPVLLLLSYKPIALTWHLLHTGYFFRVHPQNLTKHMVAAITIRPKAYHIFKKYERVLADQALMLALIQQQTPDILADANPKPEDMTRFLRSFSNNSYLRHLLPQMFNPPAWPENLDDISLKLLADRRFTELSIKVFTPLAPKLSPFFKQNVADYCQWQGNNALAQFFARQAAGEMVKGKPFMAAPPVTTAIGAGVSLTRLQEVLTERFALGPETLDQSFNLLAAGSFTQPDEPDRLWSFSDVTDFGNLGSGSFTMGAYQLQGNGLLRIMGFFVRNQPGQKEARAGARLNQILDLEKTFYLFSFDYAAQTGKESISFYLGDYIGERRVPAVKGQWKKALLLINNTTGKHTKIQPLIRMWGKGTLLVDNVCLYRFNHVSTSLPDKNTLLVEDALQTPKIAEK